MRVLVVGVGYWGPNVVRNLASFPDVEAIGVSDTDPQKVQRVIQMYPRTHAARPAPDAFRDGYDAAVIVTPVDSHASLAHAAFASGLHVLVEKPFTRTSGEARALIAHAEQAQRCLMTGHVFHYKPEVLAVVNLVRSGSLGKICYIDSIRVNLGVFRSDVNVLWDLAPHDLSIFEACIGREPQRVAAVGACHVANHATHAVRQETMAYLTLDYGDGCLGHIHVNWFSPLKQRFMVIAGDKQMALYDDLDPTMPVRIYDRGTYDPTTDTPAYPQLRTGQTVAPQIRQEEPLYRELSEWFVAIRERRKPATDGEAGLRVVRILEAAMHSLREDGRFIPLV